MDLFDRLNRFASQFGDLIADDVRAHVELGAALLEKGDLESAIHELSQALSRRPDHARALYLLGVCYLRRNQPSDGVEARNALTQAAELREGFAEAHVALGQLDEQEGSLEAAAERYKLALPMLGEPSLRAAVERLLGGVYLKLGRVDKAVRELRKAVSQEPEDAEAQGLLGQALIRLADKRGEKKGGPNREAARLCLTRASKAERPRPDVLATLGALFLASREDAESEHAFRRALEVDPACTQALVGMGGLRLAQGDISAAYELALRAAGGLSTGGQGSAEKDVHLLMARCHGRSGDPERALASYRAALSVDLSSDERSAILDEALHVALKSRHYEEAARLAEEEPLSESADGLAARALSPGRGLEDAEALLARAQAIADTGEVRLAAAHLARRRGDEAAAALSLRRASALLPGDPRPLLDLAELYRTSRAFPHDLYGLLTATRRHFLKCPELSALVPEATQILDTLDRPLLLTVMGEFNSGKSTFVNALLGEEVAPMGITPTTATINVLKYGRERGGRVVYGDDTSREISWAEVPSLLRALDEDEARRIRLVEVLYPLEILERVNVVDTPGLNSIQPEHEATARGFIAQADAIVWLFTADQPGKASERAALAEIAKAGRQVLGVINKIDRLGDPTFEAGAVAQLISHLGDAEQGVGALVVDLVPFAARDALLGRRLGDEERARRANLPALERVLEERFFARSQAIKREVAQGRLLDLLGRARQLVDHLLEIDEREPIQQAIARCQAAQEEVVREFLPAERRRLIAAATEMHRGAARETLDFVRPRRWPFGENRAAPADRDFLVGLLDEGISALIAASRERVVEALDEKDADALFLLDEQVYGHYRAFARGYLAGGKVDDFFVRVLPRLDLSEAAIGRALERDAPTSIDILEAELIAPLRAFIERRYEAQRVMLQKRQDEAELRRLDIEERLLFPVDALLAALAELRDAALRRAPGPA